MCSVAVKVLGFGVGEYHNPHLIDINCSECLTRMIYWLIHPSTPKPPAWALPCPLQRSVYLLFQLQHRLLHLGELLACGTAGPGFHLILGLLLMPWERREAQLQLGGCWGRCLERWHQEGSPLGTGYRKAERGRYKG